MSKRYAALQKAAGWIKEAGRSEMVEASIEEFINAAAMNSDDTHESAIFYARKNGINNELLNYIEGKL